MLKKYGIFIVIAFGLVAAGVNYYSARQLALQQLDSSNQQGEVLGKHTFSSMQGAFGINQPSSRTTPGSKKTTSAQPVGGQGATSPAPAGNSQSQTSPPGSATGTTNYPLHTAITATVFWVGEPVGGGSSENNAVSAWDDAWEAHYGGFDDYQNRNGYYPVGFTPKENPFYLDLPYNDFTDSGNRKINASTVVPWASTKKWGASESMMKNRWVKLTRNSVTCYGQIEDAGPYQYDDYTYVFSTTDARPKSKLATNAGMDVSPALRDCLKFNGLNNDENKVDWQFIEAASVPAGPWSKVVTTSQIYWP